MSENLQILSCPFCGNSSPFTYISFNCVVLECDCGAKISGGAACVMYKRDELPEELRPHSYEPTALVIQDKDGKETPYPDHGYIGVSALAALKHCGALDKWNKRV